MKYMGWNRVGLSMATNTEVDLIVEMMKEEAASFSKQNQT
jgi:hypothetical protein